MEESIIIIIAACLFPFIIVFFLIIAGMIFLIIMSHIPQKGIPHEQEEPTAIETATQYIEEK
ncbi:MAG: hypothetical protein IJA10_15285 [Lachnospiraceae bacterium]|nr:hypothetical protein [Lachnospiraceae bacterium]